MTYMKKKEKKSPPPQEITVSSTVWESHWNNFKLYTPVAVLNFLISLFLWGYYGDVVLFFVLLTFVPVVMSFVVGYLIWLKRKANTKEEKRDVMVPRNWLYPLVMVITTATALPLVYFSTDYGLYIGFGAVGFVFVVIMGYEVGRKHTRL